MCLALLWLSVARCGSMTEAHERLEAALEQRRVELRMSWRDLTRAADMSYEGLRAIRKGERRPNSVTKARLESALEWQQGSVDAVLAGGQPEPVDASQPKQAASDDLDAVEALLEQALAELNRLKRERDKSA